MERKKLVNLKTTLKTIIFFFVLLTFRGIIELFDSQIDIESIDIFDESSKSAISSFDLLKSNLTAFNFSSKQESQNNIFESIALANYLFDRPNWSKYGYVKKIKIKSSKDTQHRTADFNSEQSTETFKFNIDPKILNLYQRGNFSMTANLSNLSDKDEDILQKQVMFPNTRLMIRYILNLHQTSSSIKIECKTNILFKAINENCILYSFEEKCSSNIFSNWTGHFKNDVWLGFF
ncbi:hypothetical protein BpHYR1_011085 [Brachionus plicatilis]|uniref:Uncharacterized protein n=1 Tax=Brachionus plicatilis TaxID=10195 RepID=A0A3M7RYK9_BRAPC|nr:hypothetical protein BpHYR1_011085 [Brachionus plicatilis]